MSTTVKQLACPLCGHWQSGKSHFHARPVAYRLVEVIGGRRPKGWREWPKAKRDALPPVGFRVVETVYVDELDQGELVDELRLVVARLAERLRVAPREVVREVVRQVVRERIPAAFKRRAAEWQQAAAKWARHVAGKGKRHGRDFTVRGRRTHDAGSVLESWAGDEFNVRGRRVVDEGNVQEQW